MVIRKVSIMSALQPRLLQGIRPQQWHGLPLWFLSLVIRRRSIYFNFSCGRRVLKFWHQSFICIKCFISLERVVFYRWPGLLISSLLALVERKRPAAITLRGYGVFCCTSSQWRQASLSFLGSMDVR